MTVFKTGVPVLMRPSLAEKQLNALQRDVDCFHWTPSTQEPFDGPANPVTTTTFQKRDRKGLCEYVHVMLRYVSICAMIDTGASVSLMSKTLFGEVSSRNLEYHAWSRSGFPTNNGKWNGATGVLGLATLSRRV
ncbi:unnamed protein product [Clavelina lepadiformis]|uniref:Peptidase A2 domain-containing protein n=1 Tax=Clavelina lepadiformis TaxID=159417 RepID=A0ABP0F6F8_CLALP